MKLSEIFNEFASQESPSLREQRETGFNSDPALFVLPLSVVVVADRAYDSEDNHLLVRAELYAFSVIPARYEHVPIWRAHGK
jgi:hypothetical protein